MQLSISNFLYLTITKLIKTGMYIIVNYLVLKKPIKFISCHSYSTTIKHLHFNGEFVYDHLECKYVY